MAKKNKVNNRVTEIELLDRTWRFRRVSPVNGIPAFIITISGTWRNPLNLLFDGNLFKFMDYLRKYFGTTEFLFDGDTIEVGNCPTCGVELEQIVNLTVIGATKNIPDGENA